MMSGIQFIPLSTLIVDADASFVLAVSRLVEAQEHIEVVGMAHSCAEAEAQVRKLDPELILISEAMAEQNLCHDTVQRIKQQPGAPCVIILGDTPHNDAPSRAVADGWIEKAKFHSDLLPTIHNLCLRPNCCGSAGYLFHEELTGLGAK